MKVCGNGEKMSTNAQRWIMKMRRATKYASHATCPYKKKHSHFNQIERKYFVKIRFCPPSYISLPATDTKPLSKQETRKVIGFSAVLKVAFPKSTTKQRMSIFWASLDMKFRTYGFQLIHKHMCLDKLIFLYIIVCHS